MVRYSNKTDRVSVRVPPKLRQWLHQLSGSSWGQSESEVARRILMIVMEAAQRKDSLDKAVEGLTR